MGATVGSIDRYLPANVRSILEERFWRPVEESSTVEAVFDDRSLVSSPDAHPALFADHGVVHARDVAARVLTLAADADGLLLPARPSDRREFVVGLAVVMGYVHDVGMQHPASGRRMHAVFAARLPFSGEMDDVVDRFFASDGPVVRRIASAHAVAPFRATPDVVLRELFSLAFAHSKSAVPAALLGDVGALRAVLQRAALVDVEDARWYADPARDAYAWLDSAEPEHAALADDAIDAIRLVRAADALRQRGTTLRTAAGYEIFIDADTGKAVFALRTAAGDRHFLLRADSPLSAGEANVRTAVLTPEGNLRVSFHRGRFSSADASASACKATARVVADVAADVLGAFEARRPARDLPPPARDGRSIRVELERPPDGPGFAELVARSTADHEPSLAGRIDVVADLESASPAERARYPAERARYRAGVPLDVDSDEASAILDSLAAHGMKVAAVDRRRAFEGVRRVRADAGEVLVEAGTSSAFVYVAMDAGLRIEPLGGYRELDIPPWIPIGVTGVVRRAERNSTVVAVDPGDVLMIPGDLYAREWFRPYDPEEMPDVFALHRPAVTRA